MTLSHKTVAQRFAQEKGYANTRANMLVVTHEDMPGSIDSPLLFVMLAAGLSYTTPVAWLMHNKHAGLTELWMAAEGYSHTTRRHKALYEQAFITEYGEEARSRVYRVGFNPPQDNPEFCTVTTSNTRATRASAWHIENGYKGAMATLKYADLPRIRDATRWGVLHRTRHAADSALRHATQDIPDSTEQACIDAVADLRLLSNFVTSALALFTPGANFDIVRPAVQGFLALHRGD